jgi:hypothetical protein
VALTPQQRFVLAGQVGVAQNAQTSTNLLEVS